MDRVLKVISVALEIKETAGKGQKLGFWPENGQSRLTQ
jgi:hypothetical protein